MEWVIGGYRPADGQSTTWIWDLGMTLTTGCEAPKALVFESAHDTDTDGRLDRCTIHAKAFLAHFWALDCKFAINGDSPPNIRAEMHASIFSGS